MQRRGASRLSLGGARLLRKDDARISTFERARIRTTTGEQVTSRSQVLSLKRTATKHLSRVIHSQVSPPGWTISMEIQCERQKAISPPVIRFVWIRRPWPHKLPVDGLATVSAARRPQGPEGVLDSGNRLKETIRRALLDFRNCYRRRSRSVSSGFRATCAASPSHN